MLDVIESVSESLLEAYITRVQYYLQLASEQQLKSWRYIHKYPSLKFSKPSRVGRQTGVDTSVALLQQQREKQELRQCQLPPFPSFLLPRGRSVGEEPNERESASRVLWGCVCTCVCMCTWIIQYSDNSQVMWFSNQIKYLKYSNDYYFIKSIVKYTGTHKAVNKWAFRAEMDSYFELIVYKTREQPKFSPLSVRLQIHTQ